MPDFNDNELDKLFQEAADQVKPEFDIKDWEQLSARLDKLEDKGFLYRNISLYSIAILIILFTVRATWREQYATKSTPGINTSSAKEIPLTNNNETVSELTNKNVDSLAQNKKSEVENNHEANSIESKGNTADLTSSQVLNPLDRKESKKDVNRVLQRDNNAAPNLERSTSQMGISNKTNISSKTNKDLQRNSNHNSVESSNQETTDVKVFNSTDKSYPGNYHDLNKDKKGNALNTDRKYAAVTHSEMTHHKDNAVEISPLNVNKESDSLNADKKNAPVLHADVLNSEDGKPGDSDSNKNKNVSSSDVASNMESTHVTHTESTTVNYDSTGIYTTNKSKEALALNSDKRSVDTIQSKMVFYKEDNTRSSHLNKETEAGSLNGNKLKVNAAHSNPIIYNRSDSTQINDSTKIKERKPSQPIDSVSKDSSDVKTELTKKRNLFIKLPISPDFTSVGYYSPGDPGINLGLLVEYAFNKHIAVETGAIWSKKLYDAHYAKVNSVKGDCRILDMPINVKYYLTPSYGINFFVTAGFSSYVMLNEKYDYVTITANNTESHWSREYSRKNNEWFSMLNLSIGAERQVSKRLWLQAEPFFKAPIAGVGAVKIKLVSMGAFFTLKYKLN